MKEFQRAGVAVMPQALVPDWSAEAKAILGTVDSYQQNVARYQEITGLSTAELAATLREDLHCASPSLRAFAEELLFTLQASGCAAYVPKLGLENFDAETKARLVYALSACIGEPSPTDAKGKQVLWDVAPRQTSGEYFATFSEHDGEAGFHTDTQYYPIPEKWFMLYVMNPAACGGGMSVLRDGASVRSALDEAQTRWALRVLEERPFPFRVPSAFATDPRPGIIQATLAPVFSSVPGVRYRRDTLHDGWKHFPEMHDEECEGAIEALERALASGSGTLRFSMPRDSLLLVDNHRALHARSGFSDRQRHLLRVRMKGSKQLDAPEVTMVSKPIVETDESPAS